MANEKLKSLGINELKKKKNAAGIILSILVGVIILNILVFVVLIVIGKSFNPSSFVPTFFCIFIGIIIYGGKRKIDEELKRRENK